MAAQAQGGRGNDHGDPVKDAREMIVGAIGDLRNAGIEVPMSLHKAAHALAYAERCKVVEPVTRRPGQS